MKRSVPILLFAALIGANSACTPNRAEVIAMRDEPDPTKSAANLADLVGYLEDVKDPPEPIRRCAMIDVGSDLAHRVAGLQQPGAKPGESPADLAERMHKVLRRDVEKPVTEQDFDLVNEGYQPAMVRSATATWAAWKLAAWPGADDVDLLVSILGRDDVVADARLQAALAAALLAQGSVVVADPVRADKAWRAALRVHVHHDGSAADALRIQLDGLDLSLLDMKRLTSVVADQSANSDLRAAAVRQADRILATWMSEGAIPEPHRAGLPSLAAALAELAVSGPDALAGPATDATAGAVPWALIRAASEKADGPKTTVLRCAALRLVSAETASLEPAWYVPGLNLSALRGRLVDQILTALPELPLDERWPSLPVLAKLAPAQLAERLSTAWEDPSRASDWSPESWLAGVRLIVALPALPEPVRRKAAEAAVRISAAPIGQADPVARWDLVSEITAPWPSLRAKALAGLALAPPPADAGQQERLVRILVAAALAIPEPDRATAPGWDAAIDALAVCARRSDWELVRAGILFLLDHAPGRLVEALRSRADAAGAVQQEVILLMDESLATGRLPAASSQAALEWLADVATSSASEDVRLVAGSIVMHQATGTDPSRVRVTAALPLLAAAGNR